MNKNYKTYCIKVDTEEQHERIDKFISSKISELSRSQIQNLAKNKLIKFNNNILNDCSIKVSVGDSIQIDFTPKISKLSPYEIKLDIVYEDENLAVINKPSGLTVHPGTGNHTKTLANALISHFKGNLSNIGGDFRPGIVHRLDRDTSGLILIAKNNKMHLKLTNAIAKREIKRQYKALVYGTPIPMIGKIEENIAPLYKHPLKMVCSKTKGKHAITYYKVIETYLNNKFSLIQCDLETGRTHQIRVHLLNKKNPVLGDQLYSRHMNFNADSINPTALKLLKNLKRQALHAYCISFAHPITKEDMKFEIELPEDIKKVILGLSNLNNSNN